MLSPRSTVCLLPTGQLVFFFMSAKDPLIYRIAAARWGYRAFWLLLSVAAVATIGYGIFPSLSAVADKAVVPLLACAWACILISVSYFVRFLVARRRSSADIVDFRSFMALEPTTTEQRRGWHWLNRLAKLGIILIMLTFAVFWRILSACEIGSSLRRVTGTH